MCENVFFYTKVSSIILLHGKHSFEKVIYEVWFEEIHITNIYIYILCIKQMSTIYRILQVDKWNSKKQKFFSFWERNADIFGTKNSILHTIIYIVIWLLMAISPWL